MWLSEQLDHNNLVSITTHSVNSTCISNSLCDSTSHYSFITAPRDPPCPPFLRGGEIRGCASGYGNERNLVSTSSPIKNTRPNPIPANHRNNSVYSEYFVSSNSVFSSLSISA